MLPGDAAPPYPDTGPPGPGCSWWGGREYHVSPTPVSRTGAAAVGRGALLLPPPPHLHHHHPPPPPLRGAGAGRPLRQRLCPAPPVRVAPPGERRSWRVTGHGWGGDDRSDAGSAAPLGSPGEEVSCGGRGVRFRGAGGGVAVPLHPLSAASPEHHWGRWGASPPRAPPKCSSSGLSGF